MTVVTGLTSIDRIIDWRPDYHEGRPHISGTGVSVASIGLLFNDGLSPAEIQREYPGLNLEQVHAAIAFYLHNRNVIDADLERQAVEHDQAAESQRRARARGDDSLG